MGAVSIHQECYSRYCCSMVECNHRSHQLKHSCLELRHDVALAQQRATISASINPLTNSPEACFILTSPLLLP